MMNDIEQIKFDIACACRILAREGIDDMLAGHISVRVPETDEFLVTPWGLFFAEVTPEDILRVDGQGKVIEGKHPVNLAVVIHLAIHEARPEVNAIVHCHPPLLTSFSALGQELLPFDQIGCVIFEEQAIYEEFTGSVYTMDDARPIARALGGKRVAILKNHGLITVGQNLRAALCDTLFVERAARVHLNALQYAAAASHAIAPEVARGWHSSGAGGLCAGWDLRARSTQRRGSRDAAAANRA